MNTYDNENDTVFDGQEPLPIDETVAPEQDGVYHGIGAGVTESVGSAPDASDAPADPTEPAEAEVPPAPRKSHRHVWVGIAKGAVAAVTVLALMICACGISGVFMNRYWSNQTENLTRNYEERLDVLNKKLEEYAKRDNTAVIPTVDGMLPSKIYEDNIDSIVAVSCTTSGSSYQPAGSGFVLSEDGYIVTNHHVIDGASAVAVTFADGEELSAKVIGSDSTNDVALLKVTTEEKLNAVTVGKSGDLRVGDQVVAIGNALGELSFSLSVGYVSGIDRDVTTGGSVLNMIQTDVAINSGNSGGPLFNAKGEVIGITTAKYSGTTTSGATIEGISFAIPMDDVYDMLEQLRTDGYIRTAYMGIRCTTAVTTTGMQLGVQVVSVEEGGSAAKAGIRKGDVITNVGGYEITNMTDLTRVLRQMEFEKEYSISVWRAGVGQQYLTIVFTEKPQT